MALSEHEQYVIEQMEQAVSAADPKFAARMSGRRRRARLRPRVALGVLALIAGLALLGLGVWHATVGLAVPGLLLIAVGGVRVLRLRRLGRRLWMALALHRRSGPR